MKSYKRYNQIGNQLFLDWKCPAVQWPEVKNYVKDTLKARFNFKDKTWQMGATQANIDTLKKAGWLSAKEIEEKPEIGGYGYDPIPEFPDHTQVQLDHSLLPSVIRSYQEEAIQFILSRNCRAMLGLPMGAGKSLIFSVTMAHYHEDKPWLIVVPASLKITIDKEIKKWTRMRGMVAYSTFKASSVRKNHEYIVCNYDILAKLVDELKGNICGIIADEAHYLANSESKRTKAFQAIAKGLSKVVFISGTLLKNRPVEMYPMLNMTDPAYWNNKGLYHQKYCGPRIGYMGSMVYDGATNLDDLHKRVKPWLFYKSLEEILPDLPPIQDMFYEVETMDKEFLRINAEIQELIASGNYDKADLLVRMGELARSAFFQKRTAFYEMVDDYLAESDEKVVLVGVHKTVIADMVEKYDCDFISGSVPSHNRNAIIERFHASDKKVLVLQLESASTGFSILCSRTMFFGELNYAYSTYTQMKARVRRMNTVADKCLYYHFVCGEVEERMVSLMAKKQNVASQVITGESDTALHDAEYESIIGE